MRKTHNRKLRRFQAVFLSLMLACSMVSPAMAEELSSSQSEVTQSSDLLLTTDTADTSNAAATMDPSEEDSITHPSEDSSETFSETFSEESSTVVQASAAEQVEILGFTKSPQPLCFVNNNKIKTDLISGNDLTAQLKLKIPTDTLESITLYYYTHYVNSYGEDDTYSLTLTAYRPTLTPVAGSSDTYTVDIAGASNSYCIAGVYKLESIYLTTRGSSYSDAEYTPESGLSIFRSAPEIQVIDDNNYFNMLPYGTVVDTSIYAKPLMQYTFQGKDTVIPEGITLRLRQSGNIQGTATASGAGTLTIDGTVDVENITTINDKEATVNGTLLTDQLKLGYNSTFTINGLVSANTITKPERMAFGPNGKLVIKSDLQLWTDDKDEVHNLLAHIVPEEGYESQVSLLPYSDDQGPYTYKNGGWRQEVSLPSNYTELTTSAVKYTSAYADKWYHYVVTADGYYDFNPVINDYDDGGFIVEAWRDTTLDVFYLTAFDELECISTLEENPYFNGDIFQKAYRMNRAYLTKGTELWIHLVNESGGPGSFQVKKVTTSNSWLDSVFDLAAATSSVTYDKSCYQATIRIPIKDLTKAKTLDSFGMEINVPESSYTNSVLFFNDFSISNNMLIVKSEKTLMPPEFAGQTITLKSGRITWYFASEDKFYFADYVTDASIIENTGIDTDSNNLIAHLMLPNLSLSVKCTKYQAGTMTSGKDYSQGMRSLYYYTLTVPSSKDADGREVDQCYCFSAIKDSREFEANGEKLCMTSYLYASPRFEIINNSTGKALAGSAFLYDNVTHNMQVNLKAGTYTVVVWSDVSPSGNLFGLSDFTFHVLQNSQSPLATSVTLGKKTLAPGEYFPLTVKYDGNFELSGLRAEFNNASGNTVKADFKEITASSAGSLTAVLALSSDNAKAGDSLTLNSITMTDLYGKTTKQTLTGSLVQSLAVTSVSSRLKSGEKTFSFSNIKRQTLTIPSGITVNAELVDIKAPDTLNVAGTLNVESLILSGSDTSKIRPLITGTINTYYVEASNINPADGSTGMVVVKSEPGHPGNVLLCEGDPDLKNQYQLANFLRMIKPQTSTYPDGSTCTVAMILYYPAAGILDTFLWDPVYNYWDNGYTPHEPADVILNCGIQMDDKTVVYDGKPHTITAENVGSKTRVYYYYSKKLSNGKFGEETTEPPVEPGTYQVRAHFSIPAEYDTPLDDEYAILTILPKSDLATPVLSSASNAKTGVSVKWEAVTGAEKYRVYYKISGGSWTKAGDTTGTSYTVPASLLTSGKTYSFTVRCVSADGKTATSKYDTAGKTVLYLSAMTPSSLANTSSGIKISWAKVTGAKGYYIYRKSGSGSYSKIKDITSAATVSYTDTAVKTKNGTSYTYYVRAYNGSNKGSYTAKSLYRLTAVALTSVKSTTAGKMTVKWEKNTKATGYQIQYSTSSTFASGNKSTTVSGASTLSKTIGSLTKGKTYYARIRVYKTDSAGTKHYSAWSSKLSCKP